MKVVASDVSAAKQHDLNTTVYTGGKYSLFSFQRGGGLCKQFTVSILGQVFYGLV